MKSFPAAQIPLIERPHAEPLYFAHIYLSGETLYFSDRNFKFNGHDYEAYLLDIPETLHSINQTGGYLNISASLPFRNIAFRSYAKLIDFFIANPITRREMDLFVLYLDNGQIPGTDVSTKLHRLGFGEMGDMATETFTVALSSILHLIDRKKLFTQINRTNWPNAAPDAIGKYENLVYGSIRDILCHCVQTYAVSTLFLDMTVSGETYIYLSDVDYPISFPSTGVVKIAGEKIRYSAKDSSNKRLTVQTRGYGGTTAAAHTRGTPVWVVEYPVGTALNFKYLIAGHQMKAGNVIYAGKDRIRIGAGDYTVNLNDGGKTTITFTERQLQKILEIIASSTMNEGSHSHPSAYTTTWIGTSASYSPIGNGWSDSGIPDNMRDSSLDTDKYAYNNGAGPGSASATLQVNFPAWGGPTPSAVYACICHQSNVNNADGAYVRFYKAGGALISDLATTTKTTQKFNIGTSVPTSLYVQIYTGNYPYHTELIHDYEMWLEISTDNTGNAPASGVSTTVTLTGSDPEVIAPPIFCDGEGYKDDASGTYTGIPSILIENPSDIRRHLLVALLERSMSEIGDSFATARTTYAGRISGGYKFATILFYLGQTPEEIFRKLDEQSRSQIREDGGKFELTFHGDSEPSSVMTIDKTIYTEDPKFSQTSVVDIKNLIRVVFDFDYSGLVDSRKFGGYLQQKEVSNSPSITKYGELPEDIAFAAVKILTMAEDVANRWLLQKKDVVPLVSVSCNRMVRKLERGDHFILNDCPVAPWEGKKWRVLEIRETPDRQAFSIRAIQWVSS